jgi:uroporphyrinogen decarboxylase
MEMAMGYPVDVVKIGSGLITNIGPMLSPGTMEEFEFSLLREQAELVKERKLPLFFHVDGKVTPLIPQFLEMGVDILNPIDPCSGLQDIYEIKELYGDRLTLCGNIDIDNVLLKGSPEDVAEDVRAHIDRLARGGGYIVASSHNLHELIPVENFYAMRDTVHNYKFDI